jgi:hypothetical protein
LKDREARRQVEEILDRVRDLKQSASELEDENRGLRDKLRFKSDEFEFKNPFWFELKHSERPLCPKCFAAEKICPMSAPYSTGYAMYHCRNKEIIMIRNAQIGRQTRTAAS